MDIGMIMLRVAFLSFLALFIGYWVWRLLGEVIIPNFRRWRMMRAWKK